MNYNKTIYLSGSSDELLDNNTYLYPDVVSWREYVINNVKENINCLLPLTLEYNINIKTIITQNRLNVQQSDLLLVNLLSSKEISTKTIMEITWAESKRIPIILVIEKNGNIYDNLIINECATIRTDDLDDAIFIVNDIL